MTSRKEFWDPQMTAASGINLLLECLQKEDRKTLLAQGEIVDLTPDTILCEAGQPLKYVYFPLQGHISLVATINGHPPLEAVLIGNEGMLGATLILDIDAFPVQGVVKVSGTALRITLPRFRAALADNSGLQSVINRYLFVFIAQLAHTLACTHFHEVEPRLARWLLASHDRSHADHFHLTHKVLADMLGVQRSAVTIAAGNFQKQKLISYNRGQITILNRRGLEGASCECYQVLCSDYIDQYH